MRRTRWIVVALSLSFGLSAGARGAGPYSLDEAGTPPAVLDALLAPGRMTEPLERLLPRVELEGPEEKFKVVEVGRDSFTSHHLVAIRDREQPHRHDTHDLTVVILRGFGAMRIGSEERRVGQGSILYVPRATVHAFRNLSDQPAVAYAIYSPPFDGKDRVPAE